MVGTLTRTVFTQAFVLLLFKPLVISSVKQAGCLVTRVKNGDRIQYNESYNRACSARDNPCQSIEGRLLRNSKGSCVCQCSRAASTYRGDMGHCVNSTINREGAYHWFKLILLQIILRKYVIYFMWVQAQFRK